MIEQIFSLADDVRFRIVSNEAVVIRQRANEVLVLNELGSFILQAIEQKTPISELLARIQGDYNVDIATLEQDTQTYLRELAEAGIIKPIQP